MTTPVKVNLKAYAGRSLICEIPIVDSTKVFKPINTISKSAPAKVAVLKHGLPTKWQVKITDVRGMKEINSSDYYTARALSPDVLELTEVNSTSFTEFTGGGTLEYFQPLNLVGFTPRLQIRKGFEIVLETVGLEVELDLTTNCAKLHLSPAQTESFTKSGYSLRIDLIKGGLILPAVVGTLIIMKE